MPNMSCSSVQAAIQQGSAFGCKDPNSQRLGMLGLLSLIAEGVGADISGAGANSSNGIKSGAGNVNTNNLDRLNFTIQNQGTNVLYVKFGTGASASNFDYVLSACSVAANGTGAMLSVDGYTGIVSVGGTSPSYTYSEIIDLP